jgi:hypothetical protein
MRRKFIALLIATLLTGCGNREDEGIYDTAANPDGFPTNAIEIIGDIESGTLVGGEAIMSAFGDLYTQHSDLLDNERWKSVIDRLGNHFRKTADSLAQLGVSSFTLAAEYYQLGSFARPEDPDLKTQANLFGCWLDVDQDTRADLANLNDSSYGLDQMLPVTRYFLIGDSLHQQFFRSHLAGLFTDRIEKANMLSSTESAGLTGVDRALLVYAGLSDDAILSKLTNFSLPSIDFVAVRVSQVDSVDYRLELYFRPREVISEELQVYLGLQTSSQGPVATNIVPKTPTTAWDLNKIAVISRKIHCPGKLEAVAVGLSDFASPQPRFLQPEGQESNLYFLGPSELVLQ